MRRAHRCDSSDGRPGRALAAHIGGSSTVTSTTPTSGAVGSGGAGSSFAAASAVVRPIFTSALPSADVTTPFATETSRARASGRPSGRVSSARNLR